jgi:hypothetical protein
VLAHETRSAIVIDDELKGLVEPAIASITMPVLMSPLLQSDWTSII